MKVIVVLIAVCNACVSVNGECATTSDCCYDLCRPVTCSQGRCTGSFCLGYGDACEIDCQCCTGSCVINDLNMGSCGEPVPRNMRNRSSLFKPDCDGAWCSTGDCDGSKDCDICCPPGQAANCDQPLCHCFCTSSKLNVAEPTNDTNVALIVAVVVLAVAFVASVSVLVVQKIQSRRRLVIV